MQQQFITKRIRLIQEQYNAKIRISLTIISFYHNNIKRKEKVELFSHQSKTTMLLSKTTILICVLVLCVDSSLEPPYSQRPVHIHTKRPAQD